MPPPVDTLAMLLQAARGKDALPPVAAAGAPRQSISDQATQRQADTAQTVQQLQAVLPQSSVSMPTFGIDPSAPLTSQDQAAKASLLKSIQYGSGLVPEEVGRIRDFQNRLYGGTTPAVPQTDVTPFVPATPFPGLVQKAAELEANPPKRAWEPHNPILHALMAIATATKPGQAIQQAYFEPGVETWESKRAALANEIKRLQGGQGSEEQMLKTGEQMVTGPAQAIAGMTRAQAMQERADSYAKNVQGRLALGLANVNIKAIEAGNQIELNKARTVLADVEAQMAPYKLDMQRYGIDVSAYTRQALGNAMIQAGITTAFPKSSILDAILGSSVTPAAPQIPTGPQPVKGNQPLPARTAAPGKTKRPTAADLLKKYPPAQAK